MLYFPLCLASAILAIKICPHICLKPYGFPQVWSTVLGLLKFHLSLTTCSLSCQDFIFSFLWEDNIISFKDHFRKYT